MPSALSSAPLSTRTRPKFPLDDVGCLPRHNASSYERFVDCGPASVVVRWVHEMSNRSELRRKRPAHQRSGVNHRELMNFTLRIWRQASPVVDGKFETYSAYDVSPDTSFLEMLDVVNERLTLESQSPIAFDSDCREGICGACGVMINGIAHGPECGYISADTGGAPDGNAILIGKTIVDDAMDAAVCIGCGACAAACPNASPSLFVGAKITHLGLLPQGQPERDDRAIRMVEQMDAEGFGVCSWHGECQAVCPKEISIDTIARMYGDFAHASLRNDETRR